MKNNFKLSNDKMSSAKVEFLILLTCLPIMIISTTSYGQKIAYNLENKSRNLVLSTTITFDCFYGKKSNAKKSVENNKKDVYSYITIGNLEVMRFDLGSHTWHYAIEECNNLGNGWRLPTIEELEFLYKHREEIGNFKKQTYWSISKSWWCDQNQRQALDFGNGTESYNRIWWLNEVRAVRTIKVMKQSTSKTQKKNNSTINSPKQKQLPSRIKTRDGKPAIIRGTIGN